MGGRTEEQSATQLVNGLESADVNLEDAAIGVPAAMHV
jgi:hypothetical protein